MFGAECRRIVGNSNPTIRKQNWNWILPISYCSMQNFWLRLGPSPTMGLTFIGSGWMLFNDSTINRSSFRCRFDGKTKP